MLHAARHDENIARFEIDGAIAKLHSKAAAMDEKELVFSRMVVPLEGAEDLHELHVLTIELADDPRIPVIVDRLELPGEHHLLDCHRASPFTHYCGRDNPCHSRAGQVRAFIPKGRMPHSTFKR